MDTLLYFRIVFLCLGCIVTIYLNLLRNKKTIVNSISTLLLGIIITISMMTISMVFDTFTQFKIILPIGLVIATISVLICSVKFFRQYTAENIQKEKEKEEYEQLQQELLEKPAEQANKMKQMLPIGQRLLTKAVSAIQGATKSFNSVEEIVCSTIQDELKADGAVILLIDDFEDILKVKAYTGDFPPPYKLPSEIPLKKDRVDTNFKHAEFALEDNIFAEIFSARKCTIINNPDNNNSIIKNGEEPFLIHGPLMFAPLVFRSSIVGIVAISRKNESQNFEEFDTLLMNLLCDYASTVIHLSSTLRENKELENIANTKDMTSEIQRTLLPTVLKKVDNLNIGVFFNQSQGVCSDYYDVIQNQKDRIFLIVADIAGKSVQASIVMSMIRALLYLITNTRQSTDAILDWLNKGITGKIEIDHFASVSLLTYFPQQNYVEFIGAGNQSMLILRRQSKKAEIYNQKTDPIGVDINSIYKSTKISVSPGDIIAMYTDGIIETLNAEGKQYGIKQLAKTIIENFDSSSKDIAEEVKKSIRAFMGKTRIHDDQTILIIKPENS